jgi:hypothetical protein
MLECLCAMDLLLHLFRGGESIRLGKYEGPGQKFLEYSGLSAITSLLRQQPLAKEPCSYRHYALEVVVALPAVFD